MSIISVSLASVPMVRVCRVFITTIFNESFFWCNPHHKHNWFVYAKYKSIPLTRSSVLSMKLSVGSPFSIPNSNYFSLQTLTHFPLYSSCWYKSVCNTTSSLHFATAWFLVVFPFGGITLSLSRVSSWTTSSTRHAGAKGAGVLAEVRTTGHCRV
jgi:hypothetical protein